jgi:hypothetical protein
MSVLNDLENYQFQLYLSKHLHQRPEHLASSLKKHPHMYSYIHVHIMKWDSIPERFLEVVRAIERKGKIGDGNMYGTYALTLHPRAIADKKFPRQYIAGCLVTVSIRDGYVIREVKCRAKPFQKLLQNARVWDRRTQSQIEEEYRREHPKARTLIDMQRHLGEL